MVNLSNAKMHVLTKTRSWLSYASMVACFGALGTLLWQRSRTAPEELFVLIGLIAFSLVIEGAYRAVTGRSITPKLKKPT